jgi:hypothetical protein
MKKRYSVTYLCDSSQKEVDPYLAEYNGSKTRFSTDHSYYDKPSPLLKKDENPIAIFEEFDRIYLPQMQCKSNHFLDYELEMRKKCGPQGGKITITEVTSKLISYYDFPRNQTFDIVDVGVKAFTREIQARVKLVGLPQPIWQYSIRNTAAGLPTGLKKNFVLGNSSYYLAHSDGYNWFGLLQPTQVSFRRMRNKDRLVFMDSVLNVDRLEPIMSSVRNWFKENYPRLFAALHRPSKYLWRNITKAIEKKLVNLETDFKSMDQSMTFKIAKKVLFPVLKELLIPGDYLFACNLIEQYFKQPCLIKNQLWEGEHSLFSGQVITQDLENFYDICLYLGVYLSLGYSWDEFSDYFTMVGDDVLSFWESKDVSIAYEMIKRETQLNKVELSEEKTRIGGAVRFCRNVYSVHNSRILDDDGNYVIPPSYPLSLATNSIVQPENLNPNFGIEIAAIIARADNAQYNPWWKSWATWIFSKLSISRLPTDEQFKQWQAKDWWAKVYGEVYGIDKSPTYQLWATLIS